MVLLNLTMYITGWYYLTKLCILQGGIIKLNYVYYRVVLLNSTMYITGRYYKTKLYLIQGGNIKLN